jgi:hypothetical protein
MRIPLRLKTRYDIVSGGKRGAGATRFAQALSWDGIEV